jgi:glucokinase
VADLGATYLRVALARDGRLGQVLRCRTADLATDPSLGLIPGIVDAMREVLGAASNREPLGAQGAMEPVAVGLGVPAAVDGDGRLRWTLDSSLPSGTVIRDAIQAAVGVPVAIDNDANMAVLGEHCRGAGCGTNNFVLLTLGTNVGMGAVVEGQIFRGASGGAGEAGMLLVPVEEMGTAPEPDGRRLVDAGRFGVGLSRAPAGYAWLEELVGGRALVRAAEEMARRPRTKGPAGAADGARRTPHVFREAAAGSSRARELVDRAIEGWALTIANLVAILDPEAIALAGGLVTDVAPFLDQLRSRATELSRVPPRIVVAELGSRAGLVGAEIAARRAIGDVRISEGAA